MEFIIRYIIDVLGSLTGFLLADYIIGKIENRKLRMEKDYGDIEE